MKNIFAELVKDGVKVETFLLNVATGAKKLKQIYDAVSVPTIAASAAVFYDVVKAIAAGTAAAGAAEGGNVPAAIELSKTTLALVAQCVMDFKAGEKTIVADFEALGIKL